MLAVLWRLGLVVGVVLLAVGGYGLRTAGRGLRSKPVRVAGRCPGRRAVAVGHRGARDRGLPLPVAAAVGLAPGFLVVVTPLIAGLFAVYVVLAVAARRAGLPAWCAIPAGALVVAGPVAATLPLT